MISIKRLNRSFGDKKVLVDFEYEFPDKGLYIISGRSGIGKTTLLRIIAGLDKEYEGELKISAESVSMVFQEDRLIKTLTAKENVTLVCKNEKKASDLLERLGLEEEVDEKPSALSGGMKRRVAIARAFSYDSDILLMDEPTSSLDAETARKVDDMIKERAESQLVIVVTHDLSEIEYLKGTVVEIQSVSC